LIQRQFPAHLITRAHIITKFDLGFFQRNIGLRILNLFHDVFDLLNHHVAGIAIDTGINNGVSSKFLLGR